MNSRSSEKSSPMRGQLDRRTLLRMAGGGSFERGEDYLDSGRIGSLTEHGGTITAKVRGTRLYRVKIWSEEGEIRHSCTCPVGQDGAFCKHCVAVGLAWLDQGRPDRNTSPSAAKPALTMDDVRAYLASRDKSVLVDMVMDQAMDDDRLRRRLFMNAAKMSPNGLNVTAYRRAIDEAVDSGGFVDYQSAYDFASGIEEAIDSIEELLTETYASEVIGLTEYALEAVEDAMEVIDNSDGHMGDILERLQEIHLKACQKAGPDAEELARRLFEWELQTDWDIFYGAAETYSDVLGKKGLAVYRKLAEAEWAGSRFRVSSLEKAGSPARYAASPRIPHS